METALMWVGIALAGLFGLVGVYWIYIRLMLSEAPRATEIFQVPTNDGWTVRLCRYRTPENSGPPVVLCHGIMANQFSLTAPKGDSLVDVLVERGFDCWVMDARGTRSSTAPPDASRYDAKASDYALQDMPAVIDFVCGRTGYSKVHWAGHSMGGMMLYMYLAAFGSGAIASGTTLGSPPGLDHFKPQRLGPLVFLIGLVPVVVEFFWRCGSVMFKAFKVKSRLVPINWENVDPRVDAGTFFNMVEFLPYPAVTELRGWIENKRWTIQAGTIDVGKNLSKMDAPLLLVYGADDWFTPLDRGEALFDSLKARSKRMLVLGRDTGCLHDYSHVDLVFSPRGRTELYEPIAAWMEAHPVKKGALKSSHLMPRAHVPESAGVEKPAASGSLELEDTPSRPSARSKAAPRAHRPRQRTQRKSSSNRSSKRTDKPKKQSTTKPKAAKSGKKDVYATQKKVARKKRAARKSAKSGSNPRKGPSTKKKPAGSAKTAKKKAAKRKTGAGKKPASAKKRSAAKKAAKKGATTKKGASKAATKKPARKKSAKKKPAKRKR